MRVLMTLHHAIKGNSGAPGVTLAIANVLEQQGCEVDLFGIDDPAGPETESLAQLATFPERVAIHLAQCGKSYDVIDASSGDAWLWASLFRPGASHGAGLVTRSHGLEQTADQTLREECRARRVQLRRRYYLYNGGFRLWEVARSMQLADHAILLNQADLDFTREQLGVPAARSSVVPHGAHDSFFARQLDFRVSGPLRLAFVGAWIERKGIATVVGVLQRLIDARVEVKLLLLGTRPERAVMEAFPSHVRHAIEIVPSFENAQLPALLSECDILLSTSRSEGFPLTLIEGMAAGLVPLSTPAGAAREIIKDGQNGLILPYGDEPAFERALLALAQDRQLLNELRRSARDTAAGYRWKDIAVQTIRVYETAIKARSRKRQPRALETAH